MPNITKKRPTIAFFVNALEGDYNESLCNGIIDAAEENDVNLIILPGETILMNYTGQYNYNVIYEFVCHHNVDALVIASSVLCGFITKAEFELFCSRYQSIPLVSVGVPIEGIFSVLINGSTGLKQIISHLIKDHQRRRIAFIKGPEGHSEAEERFLAYQEALKENGLDYDPLLVAPGDFTVYSVENAIELLLDERNVSFDAVVAANDLMAFGVLDSLKKRNISIPNQVSVVGFDNGIRAKYSNPSLTTVKQPIYEHSKKALEMALELIKGNRQDNIILDTEMVVRESCGCRSENMQSFLSGNQIDTELDAMTQGDFKPEQITDRFISLNLVPTETRVGNLSFLRPFILNCFRVFTRYGFDHQETEEVLRSFELLNDIKHLNENDIQIIQKTLTILRKWLEKINKNNNSQIIEDFFQRLRVLLTDVLLKIQGMRMDSHHMEIRHLRGLLVEMVSKTHDFREQLYSIIPRLRSMSINNCYIYLYDKPVIYRKGDIWRNPKMVNLVMAYNNEGLELLKGDHRIPWQNILNNEWLPQQKRYTLMLNPLFVEDEHLGLILLEFNMPDNYMFESIVIEMSCALKLSLLFYERQQIDDRLQEAVKELAEYNEKLNNISQTDELTGLYNRRGFLTLAKQSLNLARKRGKDGLLFFADMDGLKKINDQYGHDEGDIAIKAMGDVLVRTFRSADIVSRLGGDEFTIFTADTNMELLPTIKKRLQKYTDEYNSQSGKVYELSITIGAVSFKSDDETTLENLISQADSVLYEEKKRKKENLLQ
ncbi:MAG: GGDEF domain-containing protein [Firmicutes bacterium]|nr:GGDEF domain-containing protein [Bacillota bacterium]